MSDTMTPFLSRELDPFLATDLALQLRPVEEIRRQYSLSPTQLRHLLNDKTFRQMVRDAKARWSSDMNAEQRVRAKAALAVEDTILDLHAIVTDVSQRANYRADAFSKLARVAQLDGSPQPGGSASNFSISINIPATGEVRVDSPRVPTRELVTLEHED